MYISLSMIKNKVSKGKLIPLYKLFPSFITITALCMGITAVRYGLDGKFHISATLIIMACFMDWLDGYVARSLNAASEFGAQLDSLADLISFGVAPGIVVYLWSLHSISYKGIGWAIVLIYISCAALRLARFNTNNTQQTSKLSSKFFTGIPMPAAAGLCLTPMILTFKIISYEPHAMLVAFYTSIVGALMVSRVPTFAIKNVKINQKYISLLLILIAIFIASILLEPWIMIPLLALIYLASIPVSIFFSKK